MTTGSIWKNLFFLSCPLVFSQVLEVLFNMSDVAVVGRFSDYRVLGAVGSTTLLVTLFTGFLIGMGCGVNVRMAHELGARRRESVIKTVHSAFVICLIVGLFVGAACFFFAEGLLGILHTKEELMDSAVLYLKIYALGMPGMALYNCGNGILSATGDTKQSAGISVHCRNCKRYFKSVFCYRVPYGSEAVGHCQCDRSKYLSATF